MKVGRGRCRCHEGEARQTSRERDEPSSTLGKRSRVRLDRLRHRSITEWKETETIRTSEEFNDGTRCVKKAILSANGENQVNIRGENLPEESERGRRE